MKLKLNNNAIQKNNAICCLFPQKKCRRTIKNKRGTKREPKKDEKAKDEQENVNNFKTASLNAICLFFLINSK